MAKNRAGHRPGGGIASRYSFGQSFPEPVPERRREYKRHIYPGEGEFRRDTRPRIRDMENDRFA